MDFKVYTEQLAFQKFGVTNAAEPYNFSFFYNTPGSRFILNDIQYLYVGTFYVNAAADAHANYLNNVGFNLSQTSEASVLYLNICTTAGLPFDSKTALINLVVFNQLTGSNDSNILTGSFVGYRVQIA